MKTGVIVYVSGNPEQENSFDEKTATQKLGLKADIIEFVFSNGKHFDIMDAWWKLTVKGMRRIVCMAAQLIDSTMVRPTGREMQLCAY